jgi:hypothetical protein
VLLAELAQIRADAQTHPDPDARGRLIAAANQINDALEARMTQELYAKLMNAAHLLNSASTSTLAIAGTSTPDSTQEAKGNDD